MLNEKPNSVRIALEPFEDFLFVFESVLTISHMHTND